MSDHKIRDHRDILLAPVVSEKSYGLLDENKYTFLVAPGANKTEIKIAVEAVFDVKVTNVNTINRAGKKRRTRAGWGKRPDTKRAIVTVADGQRIVDALATVGIKVTVSCEQGVCGTCLCTVLEGEPDHRDVFLTDDEKADNDQILLCCSRARSPKLVLDI